METSQRHFMIVPGAFLGNVLDPSSENLILNELIREYLEYNGYLNTLSVFHPETGQPTTPTGRISREVLVHELGVTDGEREMFWIRKRDQRGNESRRALIETGCSALVERCRYATGGL